MSLLPLHSLFYARSEEEGGRGNESKRGKSDFSQNGNNNNNSMQTRAMNGAIASD